MGLHRISARELQARLDAKDALVLLDVREPGETALCQIAGSKLIPMRDVPRRVGELDPKASIVCICHHGMRSAQVAGWLVGQGFSDVLNLSGGIDAWAEEVEPKMSRY
jgi:rhodanese-related sulfurtransferase